MAEPVKPKGTIDINALLQAEKARAAKAKAESEAAAKANAARKAATQYDQAVKFVVGQKNDRIQTLERSIADSLFGINRIVRNMATNTATPGDEKELKRLEKLYNQAVEQQNTLLKEVTGLTKNTAKLDTKTGKVTFGTTPTPAATSVVSGTKADSDSDGIPNDIDPEPYTAKGSASQAKVVAGQTAAQQAGGTGGTGGTGNTGGTGGTGNTGGTGTGGTGGGADKFTGSGTKEKPYLKNGKPFTGTAGGKTYQSGILVDPNALTPEQQAKLGEYGSKYLIDYFKANYPDIYKKLESMARLNESAANVEAYLSGTAWAKDVNQRTYALIGAAELANGIKLDQATKDTYRDQYLAKVKSIDEIKYDIGLKTIAQFQLDTVKPDIATSIRAGNTFAQATADYIEIYRKNLEIASSAFKIDDKQFQTLLISSANISDFEKKLRRTDQYLSQPKVQQQINANKIMVTTKYRQFGLALTAAAADNLAKNVFLGDTSNEQIDENLRQEAVKLFPAFRDRILNGESPLSIASPYIGAISRILEVPEGSLDLEDATVRKAMIGSTTTVGDKTSSTVTPLWQFEQDLYKDSRWQYTANARAKADSILVDVGSRFGVIP
jgi:hypothetical protein